MTPIEVDDEHDAMDAFSVDDSAIDIGLTPDTMTAKEALLRLKAMIVQGEGSGWWAAFVGMATCWWSMTTPWTGSVSTTPT
ncbi:hypothetical protein [Halomonas sp. E19]|uniref:hypothetical protein n=1 Tax=Halomonas sp. E19 TaxID=3397247 RepID=UPI004033F655